jgi:hypothetical protein
MVITRTSVQVAIIDTPTMKAPGEVLTEVAVVEIAVVEALLGEVVDVVVAVAMVAQIPTTSLLMTRAVADMMDLTTRVAMEAEAFQWTTKVPGVCLKVCD